LLSDAPATDIVFIGSIMPDDKSASVVSPIFLALFMVSGGLFVRAADVPPLFQVLNSANPFVFAFSALMQNEMGGLEFTCEPHELVGPPPPSGLAQKLGATLVAGAWPTQRCPIHSGEQVIEQMALGQWSVAQNGAALLAMIVAYRLAAFGALRRRFC
jgi:hypothetical protein